VVEAAVSVPARRRVVTVWLVLAVLAGVVAAVEYTEVVARSPRGNAADPSLLLPVPVGELGAIEVVKAGRLHRFERDAAGAWLYHGVHTGSEGSHAHATDRDVDERIERAVAAFGRTRVERRLPRDQAFGIATPEMVVLVYRPNESQPVAQFAVGDVAPDTVSRYVDVVGGAGVVTIPSYQIENLAALVDSVERSSSLRAGTPPVR
jgi:hypothetical protein